MLKPGLVSISFRKLHPRDILTLAVETGLEGVEWGGDIHVPHGDVAAAREVHGLCADHGIETACYGSYYRVGVSEPKNPGFASVLETAAALGAPRIRVWAGNKSSSTVSSQERAIIVEDALRIAEMAATAGIRISWEYHGWSLTDTDASARQFFKETAHPSFDTLWQPLIDLPSPEWVPSLQGVLPLVSNLHVFSWGPGTERQPLAARQDDWLPCLQVAAAEKANRFCLLEFVKNDDPAQLREDARTLAGWLQQVQTP